MKAVTALFERYGTARNAFLALLAFLVVSQVLARSDQPLNALAHGESKLDFQIGYDASTVARIFDAYGSQGRTLYAWDLALDTLFPILQAAAAILFVLVAFRNPWVRGVLIGIALAFLLLDLIENGMFLAFLALYPSTPPTAVDVASLITRLKRYALLVTQLTMLVALVVVLATWLLARVRRLRPESLP